MPANVGVVIHLVKEHEAPKSAIKSRSEPSKTLSNPRKLQVATFALSLVLSIIICHLSVVSDHEFISHFSFGMVYCFLAVGDG